ncbi:MAG: FAD-dependent oxidoreductase [Pyrinomonadaceae bacterium]
MEYDVIIIGGGPGGLSAGLWCDDLGLNAMLLEAEDELGGQLLWTHNVVENHLGLMRAENGREMRDLFLKQTENRSFIRRLGAEVVDLDVEEKTVRLAGGQTLSGRALIVATGIRRRKLNIAGEDEFRGKGVLRSGKLDRKAVRERRVVVAGGGDAALENALILAETARRVFLVHRREAFRARPEFVKRVRETPNIETLTEMNLTGIIGRELVEKVELTVAGTGEKRILAVEAVLVRVGVEPNTGLLRGKVELDEKGYVRVDHLGKTSVRGIYAVGDAANPLAPTVSSAVGMGAAAVKSIYSWLTS